ncbi:hypothetical protein [Embleya sp. NPDC005575]|uniref:hypothetical protein n=1 Tax=Embleya sp. NPDC005575 TaxID=3156892 RepID=UPI0033B64E62
MSRCVNAVRHRAAAPAVPTPAAHWANARGQHASSPRTRLTRRLFIDLRRSAGSLCR